MSDPRFARLKTDPRFRKPRREIAKVVVDDRFKSLFDDGTKKNKLKANSAKVDKYGRRLSATQDPNNLRFFYRPEEGAPEDKPAQDYARGEALMESSDEGGEDLQDTESDTKEVVLGRDIRPHGISRNEFEIDLDESRFAELDAQASGNLAEDSDAGQEAERTHRLALVNLDWDHVRASHLFKIMSSVLSSPPSDRGRSTHVTRGKLLCVRVYPSDFGKKRMAQEEKEGPPKVLFKNHNLDDEEDIDEHKEDNGNEYDEEHLRKYQLQRLRYYYAIITCSTVDAASHIYSELDGTELERSANVFDLSFVPNGMTFGEDFRDEATQESSGDHKGLDFVTDALRHSKVKLTWDDDDPERNKFTRRTLSRKEIEESDFKAYLASSSSDDDKSRDRTRTLLLGGNDGDHELLPEGWGGVDKAGDMEITFTPGLSGNNDLNREDETTLEQYLRKHKEKRKKHKRDGRRDESPKRVASSAAQLELLLAPDAPSDKPKHFDMRSVIKAERAISKKKEARKKKQGKDRRLDEDEAQIDFAINVKDDRFKALHDEHIFAIDPSNPHFKKTKSMVALLEERAKHQFKSAVPEEHRPVFKEGETVRQDLKSLVESVKRKSTLGSKVGSKRKKL